MVTLLKTDKSPGLQILRGNTWVDVPPVHGAYIINLGDMLMRCAAAHGASMARSASLDSRAELGSGCMRLRRWTNDRFKSTVHRVVTPGSCDRYSIAFFVEPNFDAVVECLPTCCGPDNPPK